MHSFPTWNGCESSRYKKSTMPGSNCTSYKTTAFEHVQIRQAAHRFVQLNPYELLFNVVVYSSRPIPGTVLFYMHFHKVWNVHNYSVPTNDHWKRNDLPRSSSCHPSF